MFLISVSEFIERVLHEVELQMQSVIAKPEHAFLNYVTPARDFPVVEAVAMSNAESSQIK